MLDDVSLNVLNDVSNGEFDVLNGEFDVLNGEFDASNGEFDVSNASLAPLGAPLPVDAFDVDVGDHDCPLLFFGAPPPLHDVPR